MIKADPPLYIAMIEGAGAGIFMISLTIISPTIISNT